MGGMMIDRMSAIALGSNLGNSLEILEAAMVELSKTPGIVVKARSHWYQTKAIAPFPQPDYLNGCAILQTGHAPNVLLHHLLEIEQQFGRVRQERNDPRTLDLDLLLFDDIVLNEPELQVPHPRMNERAFVLIPLAEIAPDWVEPISGKAIAALAQAVNWSGVKKLN